MFDKIKNSWTIITKLFLVIIAIVIFAFAGFSFANSQKVKDSQAKQSEQAVANHTQTLNEIQTAVTQLKNSNAADHAQTVKYINCVLVGVTTTVSQTQALTVYQECLAASGAE